MRTVEGKVSLSRIQQGIAIRVHKGLIRGDLFRRASPCMSPMRVSADGAWSARWEISIRNCRGCLSIRPGLVLMTGLI